MNTNLKPKGFKSIALIGISWNSVQLAILYPLAIIAQYGYPENIPALRTLSTYSFFVNVPLTCILLVGSIGLFYKRSWSRGLCLWALSTELLFGICYELIDIYLRIDDSSNNTVQNVALIAVDIIYFVAQGAVIVFLYSKGVKDYFNIQVKSHIDEKEKWAIGSSFIIGISPILLQTIGRKYFVIVSILFCNLEAAIGRNWQFMHEALCK